MPGLFDFLGDMYRHNMEQAKLFPTPAQLQEMLAFRVENATPMMRIRHKQIPGDAFINLSKTSVPMIVRYN